MTKREVLELAKIGWRPKPNHIEEELAKRMVSEKLVFLTYQIPKQYNLTTWGMEVLDLYHKSEQISIANAVENWCSDNNFSLTVTNDEYDEELK
jgi:hypothetical protein